MWLPELEALLNRLSADLPVSLVAKKIDPPIGAGLAVPNATPILDAFSLLEKNGYLTLSDSRIVTRQLMMKRPLRILFFVILTEIESKMYRLQEWSNRPLADLNGQTFNDMIRDTVSDDKLFSLQKEYQKRSEFRDDLKAISAFRNLVVHVNKKLEMETDFETAVKRKNQAFRVLKALDQINRTLWEERHAS